MKKVDTLLDKIENLNKLYLDKHPDITNSSTEMEDYNDIIDINNNSKEMLNKLKDIYRNGKNDKDIDYNVDQVIRGEEKKLEKLVLDCIMQDIEHLSNKNDVLDYIQQWDYYRNRCLINKADISSIQNRMRMEKTKKEDNFKLVYKVQHKLYEKCKDYNALNFKKLSATHIGNEDIFNMLIEAQLYNVKNAKIKLALM